MKRGDMISKLEKYINDRCYQDYQWGTEDIEKLLKFLEEAGMSPPSKGVIIEYNNSSDLNIAKQILESLRWEK